MSRGEHLGCFLRGCPGDLVDSDEHLYIQDSKYITSVSMQGLDSDPIFHYIIFCMLVNRAFICSSDKNITEQVH